LLRLLGRVGHSLLCLLLELLATDATGVCVGFAPFSPLV